MIKAVLFDFGGVLTESGKRGYIAGIIAQLFDISPSSVDIRDLHGELRRGRMSDEAFFVALNKRYGAKRHITKEQFLAQTQGTKLCPPVIDLAHQLRTHGLVTGILSNVFRMNAAALRERGFYDGFDPLFLSCDMGCAKPDKEIYDLVVARLQMRPEEILFVDDQEKCLEAAKIKGIQTLLAVSPGQIVGDIKEIMAVQNQLVL